MAILQYVFRIQEADWDFGSGVGTQKVICYHQHIDASGVAVPESNPAGAWEPFIPGPEIRGNVDDEVRVTVQNRIADPMNNFVEGLKTGAIVHWHGIELANAHDGTPVTQKPITSGQDFVYKFILKRPGVFWYHPHFDGLIQEHLGCYGPILVEDDATAELRTAKVIPHEDRTFHIALSDVSFQSGRTTEPVPDPHVPLANIPSTTPVYIRNILQANSSENFGDVLLVNGVHDTPFNDPAGNFQQYWPKGQRVTAGPIVANEGESLAFQILNTGLHRFYKIQLAFSTVANPGPGDWQVSNDLFWIGGQGGLLDQARAGGGDFDQWRIRGRKGRNVGGGADGLGAGTSAVQAASELLPGEFLLPTSARIMVAFAVQTGWAEVALRVNGFSVQNGATTADEDPVDMEIARFSVSTTVDDTFKLTTDIDTATELLINVAAPSSIGLIDLSGAPAATAFSGCTKMQLDANGVVVPAGPLVTDYAPELTSTPLGPSLDGEQVHWMPTGPFQPTPDNTRYVTVGDIVEWTIETTTVNSDHPWHIHGFSFQPIRMELNTGAGYQTLYTWDFIEYVDSIYVPGNHRLTFRFHIDDRMYIGEDNAQSPNGVVGRWLAHCHITKHADRGMMTNFIVVDGCSTANFQHVDVYLRDQVSDDGTEPTTGTVSGSPDIIMQPMASADPTADFGPGSGTENVNTLGNKAEFGQDNFIYTRVNNRGTQPGIVTTDVYWSEVSTLLTPDNWNYIGTTDPMTVDPGVLTVSSAVTWLETDNPLAAGSHACLIAVGGSEQDPRPITRNQAASYPTLAVFEDFRQFVRDYNNVAWRNFNVVDDILNFKAAKFFPVIVRGAFDRDRFFDLVIQNPFEKVQFEMPDDDWLRRDLARQDIKHEMSRAKIIIDVPAGSEMRIANLKLAQGRDYRSRFIIHDEAERMLEHTLHIAQVYVEDHLDKIRDIKAALAQAHADLRGAENDRQAERVKKAVEGLMDELKRLESLAEKADEFPREEVGRVSWHFIKSRDDQSGHKAESAKKRENELKETMSIWQELMELFRRRFFNLR